MVYMKWLTPLFSYLMSPIFSLKFPSKFWCRNRPGDEMKDKYNQFGNNPLAISEEVVDAGGQHYIDDS